MADPDAPAWLLDDDIPTFESTDGATEEDVVETTAEEKPAEQPKPPSEWRKTYKKDVSYLN